MDLLKGKVNRRGVNERRGKNCEQISFLKLYDFIGAIIWIRWDLKSFLIKQIKSTYPSQRFTQLRIYPNLSVIIESSHNMITIYNYQKYSTLFRYSVIQIHNNY